ncbi:MAG TPA: carbohydrate ABC transporter permease [Deinococcales bacterium]|nr:carbohydrate ABC transporter permease [Deinococcales bacterium]
MRKPVLPRLVPHLFLLPGAFLSALPFLWIVTTALKPPRKLFATPLFIPTYFHVQNFVDAWNAAPFGRFFLNSVIMTACIVLGQTLFSAMAGYALARLKFPGRNLIFLVILGTLMVPFPVTLIPSYLVVNWLHWIDTYQALIVPRLVSAFAIFLFRQFFLTIPVEIEEAALLDGASRATIFWRLILPLSGPVIAASAIFSFLFAWNDFLWPLIVTNSTEMRTIQVGLAFFNGKYGTQWTLLMAGTLLASLPAILVFLAAQKRFIEGVTTSGLKG